MTAQEQPRKPMVQLRPMTQAEFDDWLSDAIKTYAEAKVQAGAYEARNALERSAEEHRRLLSQGLATPNHFLYVITAASEPGGAPLAVGMTWLAVAPWNSTTAFIYDILIYEPYRRRGYASQALLALEDKTRELGLATIALHVFGDNHGARALYEKLGYEITDINMAKKVSQTP